MEQLPQFLVGGAAVAQQRKVRRDARRGEAIGENDGNPVPAALAEPVHRHQDSAALGESSHAAV